MDGYGDLFYKLMFGNGYAKGTSTTQGFPLFDVYEEEGKLVVDFALAGYKKDDFIIEMNGGSLTLRGSKKDANKTFITKGIKGGKFEAVYKINDKYSSTPTASFEDGILKLVFEIAEDKKPKMIEIK